MSKEVKFRVGICRTGLLAPTVVLIVVGLATTAARAQSADGLASDRTSPTDSYKRLHNPKSGSYTLLYSFRCSPDGADPEAGLVRDADGNLYGTTTSGGQSGYGTVFKVTPSGTETVLHSFTGSNSDGTTPYNATLTFDPAG